MNQETEKFRIRSMDGLRGLAAIYVVIFHILHEPERFYQFSAFGKSIVVAGASMVQVFFVLSGYFVTASAVSISKGYSSPRSQFFIRRFFRIMPLWTALLLFLYLQNQISISTFFANLFFYFGDMKYGGSLFPIFLSWTLQAEVIFYFLSTVFFAGLVSADYKKILVMWILAVLMSFAWRLWAYRYFPNSYLPDGFFLAQAMYFVSGILLHKISQNNVWQRYQRLGRWIWLVEVLFLISWSVFNYFDWNQAKIILAPTLVVVVMHSHGILNRLLKTRAFASLGIISYGIYLLQEIARNHWKLWFGNQNVYIELFGACGLLIVLAAGSYLLFEKPLKKLACLFGFRIASYKSFS